MKKLEKLMQHTVAKVALFAVLGAGCLNAFLYYVVM